MRLRSRFLSALPIAALAALFLIISKPTHAPSPTINYTGSPSSTVTIENNPPAEIPARLFAIGDIMLGRTVETIFKGGINPFEKMNSIFSNYDLVLGNFEGPIPLRHIQTPPGSTTFSFISETAVMLKQNHIGAVSLANNHTLDYGDASFLNTQQVLSQAGVQSFGHPRETSGAYVLTKEINGKRIALIGLNDVYLVLSKQSAVDLIKETAKDPDLFVIVVAHWGDEYVLKNNRRQEELAHAFIDAGANLIIGAHPHVVENIEYYKHSLIFYSLGNFIFDQYAKNTREGLTVGMELLEHEITFALFPVDIVKSQPVRMEAAKTKKWLANLSARSSPSLSNQIMQGSIHVLIP